MELKGQKAILIPIKPEEKQAFYELATQSYSSQFWYDIDQCNRKVEIDIIIGPKEYLGTGLDYSEKISSMNYNSINA